MKLLRGFEQPDAYRGGVVSIGNYDGVHRGHQAMVAALVRLARERGVPAVVFTFDPSPIQLLRPEHTPPSLSTLDRKAELLERCGVDCVIAYPTDLELLRLTPEEFFQKVVVGELQASGLVEGPNFFFGRDRAGNVGRLAELCRQHGLLFEVVPPVVVAGEMVSSSRIRRLIAAGELNLAVELLGHPYRLRGRVGRGAGRGRTLGFPTANLEQIPTLVPGEGVYAGVARVGEQTFVAAVHRGPNPTFADHVQKLEVHLDGFDGDLVGQELELDLLRRLRDIRSFESVEALKRQLRADVEAARRVVGARRTLGSSQNCAR